MNNKRQTVWLVSMLSLMVVLSAYYLFTEDSSPANPPVADSEQVSKIKQDAAQEATTKAEEQLNELKVNEVVTNGEVTDGASATSTKSDTASTTDPTTENSKGDKDTAAAPTTEPATSDQNTTATKTDATAQSEDKAASTAKTDQQVLDKVATDQAAQPTAAAVIDNYLLERDVENQKKNDELTTAMNDSTPKKAAEAQRNYMYLKISRLKLLELKKSFSSSSPMRSSVRKMLINTK